MNIYTVLGGSDGKESACNAETWVQSLNWEDPLEKGMATHSSILAWRIPWTEKRGRLQSMGSQRAGHNWATNATTIYKINNPQGPIHTTENYTQYFVITYKVKEYEKQHIYVYIHTHIYICIAESLCCIPETNTTL